MLNVELDRVTGLAVLRPEGALTESDFDAVAAVIDPYLEANGALNGLIIYTKDFPGWDTFGAMLKHFKFVRSHHQKLSRVALVTDSRIGDVAEKIAGHFISADVTHFPYDQMAEARSWILDAGTDQLT
jgi:hypothetical protein